jgi:hypothetical protein
MAYTSRPFNYTGTLPNQVQNDLGLANDNFDILGQAFFSNDPASQPIKRAVYIGSTSPSGAVANTLWLDTSVSPPRLKVYNGTSWVNFDVDTVDGFHASQTPQGNTIPVANSSGKIDSGWLNVYTLVPYWRVSIDETSGSRTAPSSFTVSRQLKYMTYGSIFWYIYNWGTWSTLWEMSVNCPSAMSVSGKIGDVDDNAYIYLNGALVVSATGVGFKNVSFTLNLVAGVNLIQIVHNSSGGGSARLDIEVDFDWTQMKFIPL